MRYFWGGLSLVAFIVGVGGVLMALSGSAYDAQIFGGVLGIIGLLVAYFAFRLARRARMT